MPPMQQSCSRLACRSPNRFQPAVALWQQFIVPVQPLLRQKRQSSTDVLASDSSASSHTSVLGKLTSSTPSHDSLHPLRTSSPKDSGKKSVQRKDRSTTLRGTGHEQNLFMIQTQRMFEETGDYDAAVVRPVQPSKARVALELQLPWAIARDSRMNMLAIQRLNLEIERFYAYVRPNRFETVARRCLVQKVRDVVREQLPNMALEVYGSERTGLAFALSDIDFRLFEPNESEKYSYDLPPAQVERKLLNERLRKLHMSIKGVSRKIFTINELRYGRHPLLSLLDPATGIDVQIVLANDTAVSRGLIAHYIVEYPFLRELYSVIKTMLKIRGLSDSFRGGLGSYPLFMMIVASLKHSPPKKKDVANALLSVLHFWATVDTTEKGLSIDPTELFDKKTNPILTTSAEAKINSGEFKPLPQFLLSLRDPADSTNDLGRRAICIKHLQATCRALYDGLVEDMETNTRDSLIAPLVGPVYALHRSARVRLEQNGRHRLASVGMGTFRTAGKPALVTAGETLAAIAASPEPAKGSESESTPVADSTRGHHDHGETISAACGMPMAEEIGQTEALDGEVEEKISPSISKEEGGSTVSAHAPPHHALDKGSSASTTEVNSTLGHCREH